jgi:hypothetical protein
MAITDLQISDTLETSAPSIKYTGNEGPQAPQQMASMEAGQEGTLEDIYFELLGEGFSPEEAAKRAREFYNDMSSQAPQQDSGIMKAAYGGMMRQKYGLGKFVRKLIPNEIARAAEVAAPFVAMAAPQFALPAALAGGLGTYDRTGKLGGALKSGALTYGLGALSPGLPGVRDLGPQSGMFTTQPFGGAYNLRTGTKTQGIRDFMGGVKEKVMPTEKITESIYATADDLPVKSALTDASKAKLAAKKGTSGIMKFIDDNAKYILLGSMGIAAATAKPQDVQEAMRVSRGTGLDIDGIRKEVQEALAGGEEAWAILQAKYPYVGEFPTKKAEGGRIGLYAGGVPSPYSMEDARKTSMQDKMGGITDVMKRADLFRSGDVGQMYMAQGGRIGYDNGGITKLASHEGNDAFLEQRYEYYLEQGFSPRKAAEQAHKDLMEGNYQDLAQGGRIGAEEGGLMDMGGMEKDYRNDGGFVPIGEYEKKDDVPARLSKNEFVFTADAVRGAGEGDIDKGAEIMENMMKHLEQGGQISEDSQGLAGAQEMFDVSERIGEVI